MDLFNFVQSIPLKVMLWLPGAHAETCPVSDDVNTGSMLMRNILFLRKVGALSLEIGHKMGCL